MPDGLLTVTAPSRHNDPELASVLPGWGEPLSFDAETSLLGSLRIKLPDVYHVLVKELSSYGVGE